MPTYRNDSDKIQMVPSVEGSVAVYPGDSVAVPMILTGPEWVKTSDEPYLALTGIRTSVSSPGSVSGLRKTRIIFLMASADGIVATPNAPGNPSGYQLSKASPVEIVNLGQIESLHFTGAGTVLVQAGNGMAGAPGCHREGVYGKATVIPGDPQPPVPAPSYPAGLALLWRSGTHDKSLLGPNPEYSGSPSVDAGGIAPGHGPGFAAVSALDSMGTLAVRFSATKASSALSGEEHVFGPVYASTSGLIASDGTSKTTFATTWNAGEVVTAIVQTQSGQMRIGRV